MGSRNQLSEYSLFSVFKYLPITGLLQLDKVCDRWAILQQPTITNTERIGIWFYHSLTDEKRIIIPYQSQLEIIETDFYFCHKSKFPPQDFGALFLKVQTKDTGGYKLLNHYTHHEPLSTELIILKQSLSRNRFSSWFLEKFHKIRHFEIFNVNMKNADLQLIIRLLGSDLFKKRIQIIKIWLRPIDDDQRQVNQILDSNDYSFVEEKIYSTILTMLNCYENLKVVVLDIFGFIADGNSIIHLSNMATSLTHIDFNLPIPVCEDLLRQLNMHGTSLEHVGVGNMLFLKRTEQSLSKITHIFGFLKSDMNFISMISKLQSLKILNVVWIPSNISLTTFIRAISGLERLNQLEIKFCENEIDLSFLGINIDPLPQLESIRKLSFEVSSPFSFDCLPKIFPNVQNALIRVKHTQCTFCKNGILSERLSHKHLFNRRCHRVTMNSLYGKFPDDTQIYSQYGRSKMAKWNW